MKSIVTKRGDSGQTSLYRGGRVTKNHPRIELGGALVELCSFLGMSKSLLKNKKMKARLAQIQKDLFVIGTEVSTKPPFLNELKHPLNADDVLCLEELIGLLESKNGCRKLVFCLPGENFISSSIDVSRAIARRAERQAAALFKKKHLKNHNILVYLNRLSDFLFLLARCCEGQEIKSF